MFDFTGAARSNHRNSHRSRDSTRELDIVAVAGAVAIHARQQDLTRAQTLRAHGPLNRIPPNRATATMRENFPPTLLATACVDRDHDTLAAKSLRACADQIRIFDRRGVQSDLVGAGTKQDRKSTRLN